MRSGQWMLHLVLWETEIRLQEYRRDSKMGPTWPTVPKLGRHSLRASWNRIFSHNRVLPIYRTELLRPRISGRGRCKQKRSQKINIHVSVHETEGVGFFPASDPCTSFCLNTVHIHSSCLLRSPPSQHPSPNKPLEVRTPLLPWILVPCFPSEPGPCLPCLP